MFQAILSTESKNKEAIENVETKIDKFYVLGSKCSTIKNERPIELTHETRPKARARFFSFFHNFRKNLSEIKHAFKNAFKSAPPADHVDYVKVGNYIDNKGKLQRLNLEDLKFLKVRATRDK